jgi:signal transduction histidine kinase
MDIGLMALNGIEIRRKIFELQKDNVRIASLKACRYSNYSNMTAMKKIITVIFFLIVVWSAGYAQDVDADSGAKNILRKLDTTLAGTRGFAKSILRKLDTARQDTNRVLLMVDLANHYTNISPDSAFFYGYKALALARQINFPKGEVGALRYIIWTHLGIGNYSEALQIILRGLKIAERNNLVNSKAQFLMQIGIIYNQIEDHRKALDLFREAKALLDSLHDFPTSTSIQVGIAGTYLMMNQPDSALYYSQSAYEKAVQLKINWLEAISLWTLARVQGKKGNHDLALAYLRQSLLVYPGAPPINFSRSYFNIAELYQQINKPDSCIYYANKSLEAIKGRGFYPDMIKANVLLSRMYEKRDPQRALDYSRTVILYKDSLDNLGKTTSVENFIAFDKQERQYEIETAEAAHRSKIKQYGLIGGSLVVLLIGFILYRANKIRMQRQTVHKLQLQQLENKLESQQALLNERLRISRELHDDIGGTLSGIVLYSHLAENQIQTQNSDEVEQSLNVIQQSANNMVNRLSDIVWSVSPEHNSVKNLVQKLEEYAKEMARVKNIQVNVNVPECLAEVQLPVEILHNINLLCKESINNAVKYSNASLLELSVTHSDHLIEFIISDNGEGFDIATIKKGNGLMNIQKRADEIGAKLCVRSVPMEGTTISLQCFLKMPSE